MRFLQLLLFIAGHFAMKGTIIDKKLLELQGIDHPQVYPLFKAMMRGRRSRFLIFAFCDVTDVNELKRWMALSKPILKYLKELYAASIFGENVGAQLMFDEDAVLVLALTSIELKNCFQWNLIANYYNCKKVYRDAFLQLITQKRNFKILEFPKATKQMKRNRSKLVNAENDLKTAKKFKHRLSDYSAQIIYFVVICAFLALISVSPYFSIAAFLLASLFVGLIEFGARKTKVYIQNAKKQLKPLIQIAKTLTFESLN